MDIYTISFDSSSSQSNTFFKVTMLNIIKNITKVEFLSVSVQPNSFQDIIYINIPQLQSIYTTSPNDNSQKGSSILTWTPDFVSTKLYLDGTSYLRTNFIKNTYYDASTSYKVPIGRLGSFDVYVLGMNGSLIDTSNTGVTYITMRIYSENALPTPLKPETTISTYEKEKDKDIDVYTQPKKHEKKIPMYALVALLAAILAIMRLFPGQSVI